MRNAEKTKEVFCTRFISGIPKYNKERKEWEKLKKFI